MTLSAQAQLGGATPRSIRAHDFMDTFGVNVHLSENGYHDAQAVAEFRFRGVRE